MGTINTENAITIIPVFVGLFMAGLIILCIEKRKVLPRRSTGRIITGFMLCGGALVFGLVVVAFAWL